MNAPPPELKTQIGQLLSAAAAAATGAGRDLAQLRGVAHYDTSKDLFITNLTPFAAVEGGVSQLPLVSERYGVDQSRRIALQLVYEYFGRAKAVEIDPIILDSLWADFVAELQSPVWITRCVTNLRCFQCDTRHLDLGDGIAIYGRGPAVLADLGFDSGISERLFAQWGGFSASSFVLVAESSMPKRPENLIMVDNGEGWLRCARAIGALRLVAPGDVGLSAIYVQRVAHFNVGMGGIQSHGSTVDTLGTPFIWHPDYRGPYQATYAALARLEKSGYDKAPGNLDLALRAFMSTFDRFPAAMDTKLVDAITALEAVLGTEAEIAFKLSYRVASLLAASDAERATLLNAVKRYYDARSRIVHGGRLGKKQSASLAAVDDLRNLVRRLLRSFVQFAADDARHVAKGFFAEELDAALIDAARREELRRLLGLTE
jgi:hypothetical protein